MADLDRKGDIEVNVVDYEGQNPVKVTRTGRLLISNRVPFEHPDQTQIIRTTAGDLSGSTLDINYYTTTSGKTLYMETLQAGSEDFNKPSKIDLWVDVVGTATTSGWNLVNTLYVAGNNFKVDLFNIIDGTTTTRVAMRRVPLVGATREIFAQWTGIEL